MNIWSQIARLGAALAALGTPILAKADDEPDQVEMPTLDADNQPVAAATIEATTVDPDKNLVEDTMAAPSPYIAAVPAGIPAPTGPKGSTSGLPRTRGTGGAKPHADAVPHAKPWHGGGQR